jgi:hypothetical protein
MDGTLDERVLGTACKPQQAALVASAGLDGLEISYDSDLVLSVDQIQQITHLRNSLRSCKSDSEMFQVCEDTRNDLLSHQSRFECFVANIEAVMAVECPEYTRRKHAGWSNNTEGSKADSDWERFVGVAKTGAETINKRLPCLRKISGFWGKDKVQHYGWAYAGEKYCKVLSTAASQVPDWDEASIKLNQLMLRRAKMGNRQALKHSVNPVNQIDLENLKKWLDRKPYVKMNDPAKLPLPLQKLTVDNLPDGLGFDKYGLVVQDGYTATIRARAMTLLPEDDMGKAVSDAPLLSLPSPSTPAPDQQNKPDTPTSSGAAYLQERSPPKALASAHSDKMRDPEEILSDSDSSSTPPHAPITRTANRVPSRTSMRLLSAPKHSYTSASFSKPPSKVLTKALTQAPTKVPTAQREVRCGCPGSLRGNFLELLDRTETFQKGASTETRQQLAPFQNTLCLRHLQKFASLASTIALSNKVESDQTGSGVIVQLNCTSGRRRAASDPEIGGDHKRQRLNSASFISEPDRSSTKIQRDTNRPWHDTHTSTDYRQRVLAQLSERIGQKTAKRDSWGEMNEEAMFRLLSLACPPMSIGSDDQVDAYYLTGEEASDRVESTTPLEVPIITHNQQRFKWCESGARPITQLFDRMESLDQTVAVQKPSLPLSKESFTQERLSDVHEMFCGDSEKEEAWNVLDLRSPLPPSTLPAFLDGENCQLLARVRDTILSSGSAERMEAATEEWNKWRDIEHWGLLAQGGALTLAHQDSKGLATWLTVQEGQLGFGWLCRPSREEKDAWMDDPMAYSGSKMRYTVLTPGVTVFLPPGLIHFVFRLAGRGRQTFALGGHILQWSCLDKWMETVLDQLRFPDITNEDIRPAIEQYVEVVATLVSERQRRGRVKELGGEETISRFRALYKVFQKWTFVVN